MLTRLLPTPRARDATGARTTTSQHHVALNDLVVQLAGRQKLLPTPRASDGTKGSPHQHGSRGDLTLSSAVVQLHEGARMRSAASGFDWQEYTPAIRGWEAVIGRRAPNPIGQGTRGQPRLSSRFVEWLMGLPAGYVTGLDLPRSAELRALGNGVVPQQAERALQLLVADVFATTFC